jgi:TP53 regulating kinase-like protein
MSVPSYIKGENPQLLHQGAEARIYSTTFQSTPCFVKERFSKQYRIPELDIKLRKRQLKAELKALELCGKHLIPTPKVLDADQTNVVVYLEQLPGVTLREYIENLGDLGLVDNVEKVNEIASCIGSTIARLHHVGVIHGDLTTSNMIIDISQGVSKGFFMIDFGLSQISDNVEEKAVDLYVLERAIETTHANSVELISLALNAYQVTLDELTKKVVNGGENKNEPVAPQEGELVVDVVAEAVGSAVSPVNGGEISEQDKKKQEKAQKKLLAKQKKDNVLPQGTHVLQRLNEVRTRGRKKSMIG